MLIYSFSLVCIHSGKGTYLPNKTTTLLTVYSVYSTWRSKGPQTSLVSWLIGVTSPKYVLQLRSPNTGMHYGQATNSPKHFPPNFVLVVILPPFLSWRPVAQLHRSYHVHSDESGLENCWHRDITECCSVSWPSRTSQRLGILGVVLILILLPPLILPKQNDIKQINSTKQ